MARHRPSRQLHSRPITRRHQIHATYSCHHRNATCRDWLHFGSTARIFQQTAHTQFRSSDSGRDALSTTVITRLYYHGQRIHQLFWRFRNQPIYTHNLPNFNHGCYRFTNYNQPNQQRNFPSIEKEFVLSALVFGGNARWILTKHINPQIWSKLILIWIEQLIQTLQMFVHLAIFGIFIGGAIMGADDGMLNPVIPELSGLIANAKFVFANHQFWIILPPLVVFMILILCFQMMANSLLKREEDSKKPSSFKELGFQIPL